MGKRKRIIYHQQFGHNGHLHSGQRQRAHHFSIKHEQCDRDPFVMLSIMGWRHQCDRYSGRRSPRAMSAAQLDVHSARQWISVLLCPVILRDSYESLFSNMKLYKNSLQLYFGWEKLFPVLVVIGSSKMWKAHGNISVPKKVWIFNKSLPSDSFKAIHILFVFCFFCNGIIPE